MVRSKSSDARRKYIVSTPPSSTKIYAPNNSRPNNSTPAKANRAEYAANQPEQLKENYRGGGVAMIGAAWHESAEQAAAWTHGV
jgi:hypothetical protein